MRVAPRESGGASPFRMDRQAVTRREAARAADRGATEIEARLALRLESHIFKSREQELEIAVKRMPAFPELFAHAIVPKPSMRVVVEGSQNQKRKSRPACIG